MTQPDAAPTPAPHADEKPDGGSGTTANDRRKRNIPVATDRRRATNAAEKRRTSERRRLIDPTTCERDYTDDETEFMKAMDRYKRDNRRPFPTWSEVLEVLRAMGYRRTEVAVGLPGARRGDGGAGSGAVPAPLATPAVERIADADRRQAEVPVSNDRRGPK